MTIPFNRDYLFKQDKQANFTASNDLKIQITKP